MGTPALLWECQQDIGLQRLPVAAFQVSKLLAP